MLSQSFKYSLLVLICLLTVWAPVHSWLLVEEYGLAWGTSLLDGIITSLFLGLAAFLVLNALHYYHPEKKQLPITIIGVIAMTYGVMIGAESVIESITTDSVLYLKRFHGQRIIFASLITLMILLLAFINTTRKTSTEDSQRRLSTEKMARDAELASLRQQLQPHFLFNSLNSINALIGSQPEKARLMVQQLSDFLRGTVKKDDSQLVPLFEELQQLRLYLDIEKVRFGHRLATEMDSDNASLSCKLPPLLIQPVVENAIKFGLYDTIGETVITIRTSVVQNHLVIEVENPFDPTTSTPRQGTGFGLSSLQRRLYLLYARNDLLTTTPLENIFITQIRIPQQA
jgi:two-component system, LytTR family, sensor kinase